MAQISNDASNHGLSRAIAVGTVTIAATAGNVSGSAALTVRPTGFVLTGSLNTARNMHTATLLNNGMVLVAGGYGSSGVLASAELYNPVTGTFTPTGSLNTARYNHTATLLNNGMVLIAGGENSTGALASAELYNPTTGTFTPTASLNFARYESTATVLNNGLVLVTGGEASGTYLASAELYDPVAATFTATGSLNTARRVHTATLLNDGMVLIAGGINSSGISLTSAELYEPATLTPPNLVSITVSPSSPTIPLGAGQQLIATGTFSDNSTQQLASVTWSSSNSAVVSVTDDASNPGTAYALASGSATVSACAGTVCGSTSVSVGGSGSD